MAQIDRFVRGVDHSLKDHNLPTHALWIHITNPGEIDLKAFDRYAAKINPYLKSAGYNGQRRDLKYLALGTTEGDLPVARMILFYPGFNHSTYLARIARREKNPLRSAGLVTLFMPEEGFPVTERKIWERSTALKIAGILDTADSDAFKLGVMRRYLEPPFTFD